MIAYAHDIRIIVTRPLSKGQTSLTFLILRKNFRIRVPVLLD